MVAGHLQEKDGHFYMVLSYKDSSGKRKTKWFATGLPVKGNKKRAEAMLAEKRKTFDPAVEKGKKRQKSALNCVKLLFTDYLEQWLKVVRFSIKEITLSSYKTMVENVINPYFRELNIALTDLQASDIQTFYALQLE